MSTFNPSLGKQRQAELGEFEAILVYIESRAARTTWEDPVSKEKEHSGKRSLV